MTTTQIWMLCFVGVMVLLMILSAYGIRWEKRTGKNWTKTINFQKEKQSNTVIIEQKGELKK